MLIIKDKEKDRFTLPENHPLAKIGLKVRALQRTLSTLNRRMFIREGFNKKKKSRIFQISSDPPIPIKGQNLEKIISCYSSMVGSVIMMHCVTPHCHGQHNGLCGIVVWVELGQLVEYVDPHPPY